MSNAVPLPLQAFGYVNPIIRMQSNIATVLLALGYSDRALREIHAAHARAHGLGQIHTTALTWQFLASIYNGRREWREMQIHTTDLITFATTHSLSFWWAQGTVNLGIAIAQQGHLEEGLNHIQQGLAVYRTIGATLGMTRVLGWLAEIYRQTGQLEQGLATLDEALCMAEHNDERIWEAESYRREGEFILQQFKVQGCQPPTFHTQRPAPSTQADVEWEAEKCFLKAIDIARQQQAKSWEL